MGFSLYWTRCNKVSVDDFKRFKWILLPMLKHSRVIRDDDDCLMFEAAKEDESCETFVIDRTAKENWNFCKTARLPYTDDVAKAILLMAECGVAYHFSSDDREYYEHALDEIQKVYPLTNYEKIRQIIREDGEEKGEDEDEEKQSHCVGCHCKFKTCM